MDYQGRSFLHPPHDVGVNLKSDTPPNRCFLPKTHIHTWQGHSKGISAVKWFPKTAHLMLSSSMDCRVKVRATSKCYKLILINVIICFSCGRCTMREGAFKRTTAIGRLSETFALTILEQSFCLQVCLNQYIPLNQFQRQLFSGYDRYIKLWDTETGRVKRRFSSRKIPYCVKFHPLREKQHLFVAGTSDKKIICVSSQLNKQYLFCVLI